MFWTMRACSQRTPDHHPDHAAADQLSALVAGLVGQQLLEIVKGHPFQFR